MFEVGAVVHAGCQHHHRGLGRGRGTDRAQGFEQQVGVVGDRRHAVLGEQVGEQPHHHLAVFQHVAHAAGHAQVVFEHVVLAFAFGVRGAHDVHARDVRVHTAGHVHAHHLGAELRVLEDLVGRDVAGLDDFLVVVDVVDEAVERRHPLHQTGLHALPLVRGNHARDQIEGDQPLGAGAVFVLGAVDGESDADTAEDHFRLFAAGRHDLLGLLRQPPCVVQVVGPHLAGRGIHFVKHRSAHGLFS